MEYQCKKIYQLIIYALLISLSLISGCATNQPTMHSQHELTQNPPLASSALVLANLRIQQFELSDASKILMPYVTLLKQLDSITDEEICLTENQVKYRKLYQLNQSSLMAISLMLACEVEGSKKRIKYLSEYQAIATALLTQHNGVSIEEAVKIRELSEAEFILSSAGYTILDQEIILNGDRFLYKIHAVDDDTGEFEYHYYDNFGFIKKLFNVNMLALTDQQISSMMIGEITKTNHFLANNFYSSSMLNKNNYQGVVDEFAAQFELTAITQLNLAKAFFYLNKDELLEQSIDKLVDQKDLGDINSAVFIAEILIQRSNNDKNKGKVDEILREIDQRTLSGTGAFLLAKSFFAQNNTVQFKHWAEKAEVVNYDVFHPQIKNLKQN